MNVGASRQRAINVVAGLLCAVCLAAAGCGGGSNIAPTRGTMSVMGEKLTHGRVMFMPIGGGEYAVGEIQPDGSFVMSTVDDGDGALVGQHSVMITQREEDVEPGKRAHNFESPAAEPFVIEPGKDNVFEINIDTTKGWQPRVNG